ncbi:MAG TPA: hypothetical protein VH583_16555 [Vicinamibacterales bacterium]
MPALLVAAAVAHGQTTGASRFALAQVNDPRGRAIVDVSADDFVVQEAGADREILDVRVADYPIALVIDNGVSAKRDFGDLRSAALRLLDRLGPRPIALVASAPTPTMLASFEDERETVRTKLQELEAIDQAGQPLAAAGRGAEAIRSSGALFSAIVVLSAASTDPDTAAAEPSISSVVDSRAVLHVVNLSGPGESRSMFRGLADQTHGDFTAIFAGPSYQPAVDRITARLTTELLIEYIVPVASSASDVKIGIRIPGARVRGLGVAPR